MAKNASTDIKFINDTREGFDVGYDAGLFTTDKSFALYTKLVEDNGVEFQLQCLPPSGYDKMVIPVGIDSKTALILFEIPKPITEWADLYVRPLP